MASPLPYAGDGHRSTRLFIPPTAAPGDPDGAAGWSVWLMLIVAVAHGSPKPGYWKNRVL